MLIKRVLIVGLGSIGKRHLRLARELLPDADIRVLRHVLTNELPEFANGCFFDIETAIAFAPDVAVIASPASHHIKTARVLALAGISLLIEKPLSSTLDGVSDLLGICEQKKLTLLTGYNLRFLPSLQHFRNLLKNKAVGKILSVRCEVGQYLPSWRPDLDYREGVSASKELGGGALLELSHEIDYLVWIFGGVEWVKSTISKQSDLDINVEDTVHLTLGFRPQGSGHGLIATVNLDFIRHDVTRTCLAIGENGSLRWNGLTGEISSYEKNAKEWHQIYIHSHERDDSYREQWKNFIACLSGESKPRVTVIDGLRALQIVDAARKSDALKGRLVELDETW